jgi:hypothetical protein
VSSRELATTSAVATLKRIAADATIFLRAENIFIITP